MEVLKFLYTTLNTRSVPVLCTQCRGGFADIKGTFNGFAEKDTWRVLVPKSTSLGSPSFEELTVLFDKMS